MTSWLTRFEGVLGNMAVAKCVIRASYGLLQSSPQAVTQGYATLSIFVF